MIDYFLLGLFMGFVLGVIEAWNKKVHLMVMISLALFLIAGFLITGSLVSVENIPDILRIIVVVAGYLIGSSAGKRSYKEAFGGYR